ncbi:metal ABC transporter ATP-binding protein [Haloimpatiens massiliensis]|uniref:metal ABC transporter ATP-binding protein n=1 Tax=Haloimpatiens massiliensis TaxID=1658110 RepID=UPI000C865454|nr:metal ABC transporter ATP-binding protein [Haloimpatiens massiliensis]
MKNIIEIKNLTVYYDSLCALEHINLNIKKGDFMGILGPNGGGKSTLLKSILGLIKPSEGSIKILGNSINKDCCSLGYVPQFSKFDKKFPINVMDVVLSGTLNKKGNFFHRYSSKDREEALKILKALEIDEFKDRQIGMLSGGQLQRVLIARALISNPEVLLMDEPTASLDVSSKAQIYTLLKDLNKNKTVLIVSHDLEFISSYVNSVVCLNKTLYFKDKTPKYEELVEKIYGNA